jgi:hypothetical protein
MRLIKNGTFKDVQRANIKLAVTMIENVGSNDAFVGATVTSTVTIGASRRSGATKNAQRHRQLSVTVYTYPKRKT